MLINVTFISFLGMNVVSGIMSTDTRQTEAINIRTTDSDASSNSDSSVAATSITSDIKIATISHTLQATTSVTTPTTSMISATMTSNSLKPIVSVIDIVTSSQTVVHANSTVMSTPVLSNKLTTSINDATTSSSFLNSVNATKRDTTNTVHCSVASSGYNRGSGASALHTDDSNKNHAVATTTFSSSVLYKPTMNGPINAVSAKESLKINCIHSKVQNNIDSVGASHGNMEHTNGSTSSIVESPTSISMPVNAPMNEHTNCISSKNIDKTDSSDNGASSAVQINENHTESLTDVTSTEKSEVKQGMITVGYTLNNDNHYTSPYILSSLNKLDEIHKITKTPLVDKINSLPEEIVNSTVVAKLSKKFSTIPPKLLDLPTKCKSLDMMAMNGNHLDLIAAFPNNSKLPSLDKSVNDHLLVNDNSGISKGYKTSLHNPVRRKKSVSLAVNMSTASTVNVPYVNATKTSGLCKTSQESVTTTPVLGYSSANTPDNGKSKGN